MQKQLDVGIATPLCKKTTCYRDHRCNSHRGEDMALYSNGASTGLTYAQSNVYSNINAAIAAINLRCLSNQCPIKLLT